MTELDDLVAKLRALPAETRRRLVVRSHPFGDLIDCETREVVATAQSVLYAVAKAAK